MKRQILISITHLGLGGAEKALVSLLNVIDYNKYDVDLQLINDDGFNLKFIPDNVNYLGVLYQNNPYLLPLKQLIIKMFPKVRLDVLFRKLFYVARSKGKNQEEKRFLFWQYAKPYIKHSAKKYDTAIAFLDGHPHYYIIDKVSADFKVLWVHNDYSKMPICKDVISYFKKADCVSTISQKCADELQKLFPELTSIRLVYNINSPELIWKLSNESTVDPRYFDIRIPKILSIGRICEQKAYHLAVEAAKLLKQDGVDFKWYILGDGELRNEIEKQVCELGVEEQFIILGVRSNPYPYIKEATVIAQTSIFEGKSIALDESKIMKKPIVCTNYNSAKDQIKNGINGLLVPITAEGIACGIKELLLYPEKQKSLITNLEREDFGVNDSLDNYYKLFDGKSI